MKKGYWVVAYRTIGDEAMKHMYICAGSARC